MDPKSDQEFDDTMRQSTEGTGPVSKEKVDRFYDRMRESIRKYLDKKGAVAGTAGEYLLLAPDVFVLLWRLVNDSRVNSKNKVMLGTGIAYYLFPLDLIPEAVFGPMGYIDDLVFAAYLLKRMLSDTDAAILREHWSGRGDILDSIRKVLDAADSLVGKDIFGKFRK